jgi:putative phage-type endonuclease
MFSQNNMLQSRINYLIKNSIKAQTDMWFTKRASMISATDFSIILGLGHGTTQKDLIQKKLYNVRSAGSVHTLHGQKFEPIAIEILEKKRNIKIEEVGFTISENTPFLGATPDGITIEDNQIKLIEIKCPLTRQIDGCVPYGYYTQIQLQLYVCDVEECLFFECNLEEITKEKYERLPSNITKGYNIDNNCYWILHESNLVRVKRDRYFFNKYFTNLKNFHIEYSQARKMLKQPVRRSQRLKRKYSSENDIEPVTTQKRKLNNSIHENIYKFMLSTGNLNNYTTNNKCEAWLSIYGNKYYKDEKKVNQFTKQLLRKTTQLKKKYIEEIKERCIKLKITYELLPKYAKYNQYLKEMTERLMSQNIEVIINPTLADENNRIYCNPNYIIKANVINKLFPNHNFKFTKKEMNQYIVVNKACKNLKFLQDGKTLSSDLKHKQYIVKNNFSTYVLNLVQKSSIMKSILVGTKWNYIHKKKKYSGISDSKVALFNHNLADDICDVQKYRLWLREIYSNDNKYTLFQKNDYLPCYSKSENTDWSDFKKTILIQKQDISLLYGIGRVSQYLFHQRGIYSWTDPRLPLLLKSKDDCIALKISKRDARIMYKMIEFNKTPNAPFICPNQIQNAQNWLHTDEVEFFVDFETINNFLGDINMIYLVGMYCKLPNNNYEYYSFFAEKDDLESENKMMKCWLDKMEEIKNKYRLNYTPKVFCWSKAEQSFINAYNRRHNENIKVNLVDMLELLKKEIILIKGNIYGFSIKDVVKYMYSYGMINRNYKLDCSSGDLSIISAIKYYRHDDKKEYGDLIKYNQTDCIVMYDIIAYLRNFYK